VRLERGDGDLHPAAQRQRVEQAIELCLAVGAVQAESLPLARCGGRLPQPHEVPLAGQPRRGGRLGAQALVSLGLPGALRRLDVECNQELHGLHLVLLVAG